MSLELNLGESDPNTCLKNFKDCVLFAANDYGLKVFRTFKGNMNNSSRLYQILGEKKKEAKKNESRINSISFAELKNRYHTNPEVDNFKEFIRNSRYIGHIPKLEYCFTADSELAEIRLVLNDTFSLRYHMIADKPIGLHAVVSHKDLQVENNIAQKLFCNFTNDYGKKSG